jgi:predicted PurR-regulated permease PerM
MSTGPTPRRKTTARRVDPAALGKPDAAPVLEAAPNEFRDPLVRAEFKRAGVWFSIAVAIALVVLLIQPLLLIFGGLVFAAMLDGGVRLLGRVLPIGRGWRLAIVSLGVVAFLVGTFWLAGVQIAQQAQQLAATVQTQFGRLMDWAQGLGIVPGRQDLSTIVQQALGSVGRITSYAMGLFGALTSLFMIMVIGLFVAMEPRLYERGMEWLVPTRNRAEFAILSQRMGTTMRRLMFGRLVGMAVEGVATAVLLWIAGVPMALVLGILTGVLAFIPNIGAFISGTLMVAVGFSAGVNAGFAAIAIYIVVQTIDGYVIIPMVARRTVDLPPALTLGAQILSGTLFGIMGLALADPMVAMAKVALERRSEREEERA